MSSLRREELIQALPYARRYARALAGSQTLGDELVATSLTDLSRVTPGPHAAAPADGAGLKGDARLQLYAAISGCFGASACAGGKLSTRHRQLLLLTSLEELSVEDAGSVLGIEPATAAASLSDARTRVRSTAATDVLIIEDEPIIAMDIEELVLSCGHRVIGVAATEQAAVDIAARTPPGLILADINLGIGGTGSSAVSRILATHHVPVIFVTAYPERLLTGGRGRAHVCNHKAVRATYVGDCDLSGRYRRRRARLSPPDRQRATSRDQFIGRRVGIVSGTTTAVAR